ncbi:MAG: DUF642 domain-containing protein [Actinomycetota bacterium]|nr:DUF642 domain-containing protein [Actinomycetota bacterium]
MNGDWHPGRSALAVVVIAAAGLAVASSAVASGAGSAAEKSVNLVVNGSFEQPVIPSLSYQLYTPGQRFEGWNVVGPAGSNVALITGDFMQNGFLFDAQSGRQDIDLTGTSDLVNRNLAGVSQSVATVRRARYTLTFWVGNVVNPGGIFGANSTVEVTVNGKRAILATNGAGKGSTSQVWRRFRVSFRASSRRTTLAFLNYDPASDTANALDSVSLVRG